MDGEVRLTGVYNSLTGKLGLYLGHNQNGVDLAFSIRVGSGDFAVGKGFTSGTW